MLFFLAALLRESWLLLLLLGLLPWPSCRLDRLSTGRWRPESDGDTCTTSMLGEEERSPPSEVSDVFLAGGVARLPAEPRGAWRGGGGRLTADGGLVLLGGLWDSQGDKTRLRGSFWSL